VIYSGVNLIIVCTFADIMGKFDYKAIRAATGARPLDSGMDEFQNSNMKARLESS